MTAAATRRVCGSESTGTGVGAAPWMPRSAIRDPRCSMQYAVTSDDVAAVGSFRPSALGPRPSALAHLGPRRRPRTSYLVPRTSYLVPRTSYLVATAYRRRVWPLATVAARRAEINLLFPEGVFRILARCTTPFRVDEQPRHAVPASPHQDTDTDGAQRQQDDDETSMHAGTSEAVVHQEETPAKVLLLRRWSEMPQHLQFNPHIHTGYRPLMTIRQCLGSLFYIHNETVNILTHGFAILYMLLTVPHLLPWNTKGTLVGILSWCHLIGAVSPWVGSFLYHLFMNVNYDEVLYRTLLKVDMIGIWLCQSFGAIPMMAAAVHCLADNIWYCCIFIYCTLSIWGLLKAMTAGSPWERRLCFAPPFLMRMLVMTLRCFGIGGGSPDALIHIILQDLVAVIGATIGALRIPEKWIPGRLDLVLNSHNVMHVMVVLAVCSMHTATLKDLAWMSDPSTCNKASYPPSDREEL